MRLHQARLDDELAEHLIDGRYAADPLDEIDAEELRRAWDDTERARHASCGLAQALRILIASAYSLGARHALEQTERWTLAPGAECDKAEEVNLSLDVQAPPPSVRKWRTWDQLTPAETWEIMHAVNPPSLRYALGCVWKETPDGWAHTDRSTLRAEDIQ